MAHVLPAEHLPRHTTHSSCARQLASLCRHLRDAPPRHTAADEDANRGCAGVPDLGGITLGPPPPLLPGAPPPPPGEPAAPALGTVGQYSRVCSFANLTVSGAGPRSRLPLAPTALMSLPTTHHHAWLGCHDTIIGSATVRLTDFRPSSGMACSPAGTVLFGHSSADYPPIVLHNSLLGSNHACT